MQAATPRTDGSPLVDAMAAAIIDVVHERGAEAGVSSDDLQAAGFTPREISLYGPAARARAVRQIEGQHNG
jgi:hypothetical protein